MTSLLSRGWARVTRPVRDDSGFSLIESVIALLIATVAFTALAAGTMSAIRGTLTGRQSQQAADFMGRKIEELRLVDFGGLANLSTDSSLATDGAIGPCPSGGGSCVDPGNGSPERLVTDPGGAVGVHAYDVAGTVSNRTTFHVKVYVTAPNWAQRNYYRRLTVVISWQDGMRTRTRSDSTIVTYTQRGLPLPVYKLTPVGATSLSVNLSAQVVYGFSVTNQGAPDRFNLSVADTYTTGSASSTWDSSFSSGWLWYRDDGNGAYGPEDHDSPSDVVVDTNADGIIDTDKIDPNGSAKFWIVRQVASSAGAVGGVNTTVTATSVAQPAATGAVKTLPFATTVVNGVVTATPTPTGTSTPTPSPTPVADCTAATVTGAASTGYTLRAYTLHNIAAGTDSAAQQSLAMAITSPYTTTLHQYSTDVMANQPGRVLLPGGTAFPGGATDPTKVADWRFPVGAKAYSGSPAVNLWVAAPSGGSLSAASLTAYVYKYTKQGSSYSETPLATIPLTVSSFTCSGFQKVGGSAAMTTVPTNGNDALGPNDWMGVRIVNSGATSVRIAYDVLSVYPAALTLPEN
jgi:type II secretory pathway pseudopilin PulG